jgi:hypothetical protein
LYRRYAEGAKRVIGKVVDRSMDGNAAARITSALETLDPRAYEQMLSSVGTLTPTHPFPSDCVPIVYPVHHTSFSFSSYSSTFSDGLHIVYPVHHTAFSFSYSSSCSD